jgi:glycosyltransferase involved in cell wall biosynthesis
MRPHVLRIAYYTGVISLKATLYQAMRIALLSGEYPPQPGGVGDYTRRLGEALLARGHDVFVFTIADCRFQILDLGHPDLNPKSKIQNPKSDWGWRCWRAVIAALEQTRPDVLHIQYQTGAYGMHPAINLLPWRLRRLPARPRVATTAHDLLLPYLFPKAGPARRWVTRRLLADSDAVVVTNEADLNEVQKLEMRDWNARANYQLPITNYQSPIFIPIGSNIPVAPPPGYERGAWRAQMGVADDDLVIAYFGLISRTKGLHVLLDALQRLPPGFRLLIVGGAATQQQDRAYAAEIERQIDERGLRARVIVTGHCDEATVSAHLLAADMAALPFADGASFRRGSLLAVLAHGVPTITTTDDRQPTTHDRQPTTDNPIKISAVSGQWSMVGGRLADGENALLVPPEDVGALAAALARLAGDVALREQLSAGGRALAAQFAWATIAERHEALYHEMTRQHRGR